MILRPEGKLQFVSLKRNPQEFHQAQEPVDLQPMLRIGEEAMSVGAILPWLVEARGRPCPEQDRERIGESPIPVELKNQIETVSVNLIQERRESIEPERLLGEPGIAGEFTKTIQVRCIAIHEFPCPGKTDQDDLRFRQGRAERPHGRHCTEQIAHL